MVYSQADVTRVMVMIVNSCGIVFEQKDNVSICWQSVSTLIHMIEQRNSIPYTMG